MDDLTHYINLGEEAANMVAGEEDRFIRIVSQDGNNFAITMDYVPNRVNITLIDGYISIEPYLG